MSRHLYSTKFVTFAFIASILFHAMILVTIYLAPDNRTPLPIPVNIVNLPADALKQLPPLPKPVPVPPVKPVVPRSIPKQVVPEKPLPRTSPSNQEPKKFGNSDDVTVPRTGGSPGTSIPEGTEQGTERGKAPEVTRPGVGSDQHKGGPLPFLSQNDIDQLARKGMPEKKAGDDSVTLDTDEFKFIAYNRWLEVKVNQYMRYPELAKASGLQGVIYIQFTILKDGTIGAIDILKSSGYKILDDEVVESIRRAGPFQPLPEDWHMDRYSIRGYGVFYLGQGYIR